MNKKISIIASIGLLLVGGLALGLTLSNTNNFEIVHGAECSYHHGYHYEAKDPDMNEAGHREFWACCVCGHQYLSQPNGEFITQDDQYMIGVIDENHIAYLPPTNSGGGEGNYWITDPFDEE